MMSAQSNPRLQATAAKAALSLAPPHLSRQRSTRLTTLGEM